MSNNTIFLVKKFSCAYVFGPYVPEVIFTTNLQEDGSYEFTRKCWFLSLKPVLRCPAGESMKLVNAIVVLFLIFTCSVFQSNL